MTAGPHPLPPGLATESAEELYEHAPCGYLSTAVDGRILRINATLLSWLGRDRAEVVDRMAFSDLLTVGGRIYHETHFAPLLQMQDRISGIALELRTADGRRMPVLVASVLVRDPDGRPTGVRTAVFDADDRRSYERELLRARREAELERERAERLAATLQRSLLPPVLPDVPGMELAAHFQAASPTEVGGDFYDVFPLGGNAWGVFIGDVCGKGAEAAAITSLTRYTLRAAAVHDPDPVRQLHTLDAVLHQEGAGTKRFCTVITAVLRRSGPGWTVELASGGHPPALLLRATGTAEYLDTPGGQIVGALREPRFASATATLHPGDTLVLVTDGLLEMRTGDGTDDRYDEDLYQAFMAQLAPASAAAAVAAIRADLIGSGEGIDDDTAVLALGVPPA
ncbi:MAG TPA: SpoIIE family protein phosphatase [Pseudonocardia sp.]|uniref:PP2C family protein-serine/threonine phosphatase n=1 Tax=Pseudonocardia sp. TaxID=60912 RepID=UPI002B4B3751|nr:SpoIIE family protein phosphatase [Pseudonocardia sp.]HLU56157.1 SpoIIE family protein phosphatase [Pseudonocardia sp.]